MSNLYIEVITSLQKLMLHPNFVAMCETWRKNRSESVMMRDVHDGQIWKDFLFYDGKLFLDLPYNFALHLNVDWFCTLNTLRESFI